MAYPARRPGSSTKDLSMLLTNLLVQKAALEKGFDLVGIMSPDALHEFPDLQFARTWWEKGYGGKMRYLGNPKRWDPRRILPDLRSVISVGLVYNTPFPYSTAAHAEPSGAPEDKDKARGWISRYAWGRDYHEILRTKLEAFRKNLHELAPQAETRVSVDTGPVVERAFARLSGMGWMGKNTCLINEEKGSWFFLGVLLTNLELEAATPAPDRCGSCTRCLEACPTGAFPEPYVMDASRCISYLTIELREAIPEEFRTALGRHVFGCDICQDVCPWNRKAALSKNKEESFQPLPLPPPDSANLGEEGGETLFHPSLERLASLTETEEEFRRFFRLSPVKRAKFRGWLRNLSVAMGNSGRAEFVPWLEKLAEGEDALLREHAAWALERIRKRRTSKEPVARAPKIPGG